MLSASLRVSSDVPDHSKNRIGYVARLLVELHRDCSHDTIRHAWERVCNSNAIRYLWISFVAFDDEPDRLHELSNVSLLGNDARCNDTRLTDANAPERGNHKTQTGLINRATCALSCGGSVSKI